MRTSRFSALFSVFLLIVGLTLHSVSRADWTLPTGTGGAGGGTTDHALLASNLAWGTSGHTGTASRIAAFDGAGAAAYLAVGTDVASQTDLRFSDTVLTLTDAASVTWNTATSRRAKVTVTATRAIAAPTNLTTGGIYVLEYIQDGTGGWDATWDAVFVSPPPVSLAANAKTVIAWQYDGTSLIRLAPMNRRRTKVISASGSYTLLATDDVVIFTSASSSTVDLPACPGARDRLVTIKQAGAGVVTLDGNASETIDGATTHAFPGQYYSRDIICGSSEWSIL